MMKFAKNYMESIEGIAVYPVFSLFIFFIFFMILFWWVATAKKDYLKKMSQAPLESNDKNDIS